MVVVHGVIGQTYAEVVVILWAICNAAWHCCYIVHIKLPKDPSLWFFRDIVSRMAASRHTFNAVRAVSAAVVASDIDTSKVVHGDPQSKQYAVNPCLLLASLQAPKWSPLHQLHTITPPVIP